jgi:hypothetical protein
MTSLTLTGSEVRLKSIAAIVICAPLSCK